MGKLLMMSKKNLAKINMSEISMAKLIKVKPILLN
jgi:hypothetical protein